MSSLESIEGNTWRGIAPSAEGMGEFFGFVILFSLLTNFYFKKKLNYLDFLLLFINILGLRDKGFQIKTHKGKDGGQEVFHFHLHLLSNA